MIFQFQHSRHLPVIIWHSTGSSLFAVGLSNLDPNKAHTLHLAEMPLKSLLLQNRFLSIKKTPKPCNYMMRKSAHMACHVSPLLEFTACILVVCFPVSPHFLQIGSEV